MLTADLYRVAKRFYAPTMLHVVNHLSAFMHSGKLYNVNHMQIVATHRVSTDTVV